MKFLKNHPFAVEAFFDSSVVLTFALPKDQLKDRIPECLMLDTHDNTWAFMAVAMVQTRGLRPKGFPRFMGNDFFLIGYRIFVRYVNSAGKRLRGLYIIKSETDKKKMEFWGNLFTHYHYTTTDIDLNVNGDTTTIDSSQSGFHVAFKSTTDGSVPLPAGSPFHDWKEARRFAGPLPHTFTYDRKNSTVLIIEGIRENWSPLPLHILSYKFRFLQDFNVPNAVLANAFLIKNIPYHWKKGKLEKWIRTESHSRV